MVRTTKNREEGHHVTIGGIVLESDTGKLSFIEPIARYEGLNDEQVQDIWHHLQTCPDARKHQLELSKCILSHMTEYGDKKLKNTAHKGRGHG